LATKLWKVTVSPLTGKEPLAQVSVEANNWIDAVRNARQKLGENALVPPGSSCAVAPDGVVTVLDPLSQRKFVLRPDSATTTAAKSTERKPSIRPPAQGSATADISASAEIEKTDRSIPNTITSKEKDEQTAKHRKFHTVAYQAKVQLPNLANEVLVGDSRLHDRKSDRDEARRGETATAKIPERNNPEQLMLSNPTAEVTAESRTGSTQKQETVDRNRDASAPTAHRDWLRLMLARNEDSTPDNPLLYRERCYLVPKSLGLAEIEGALREQLEVIERELSSEPTGKFVNLAAFDHVWHDKPERPPLIVLQWKDWRNQINVDFPASAKEPKSSSGRPLSYDEDKLTKAFESLHNLTFLNNAAEGMDFVIALLQEAIGFEAASGYVYDINTHELRLVVASGPGSENRKGHAVPLDRGILSYCARQDESTKTFCSLEKNPNFDPEVDSREGLTATSLLIRPLVLDTHLLGMIQLINRKDLGEFTAEDASLVNYVGKQLTDFLKRVRLKQVKK
jgi:GAF domain-containing protein